MSVLVGPPYSLRSAPSASGAANSGAIVPVPQRQARSVKKPDHDSQHKHENQISDGEIKPGVLAPYAGSLYAVVEEMTRKSWHHSHAPCYARMLFNSHCQALEPRGRPAA